MFPAMNINKGDRQKSRHAICAVLHIFEGC